MAGSLSVPNSKGLARAFGAALIAVQYWAGAAGDWAQANEQLRVRREGHEQTLTGRLVVEAKDGGLLVELPSGQLEAVQPDQLLERSADDEPFKPLSAEQVAHALLSELPDGFEIHRTAHFVICYRTSREYAQWCGSLFERLYKGFVNYWSRRGLVLHEPRFPLPAIVFGDRESYVQFARGELGEGAREIVGYYSLKTNRVTMYDLTGSSALRGAGRRGSSAEINLLLSQPEAEGLVATIVHEATHQLAFNTGMQARFADIPAWVSEGLAVYFEKPDLKSAKGWSGIGGVHGDRLDQFREYLAVRPAESLTSLIVNDQRIRTPRTAVPAYAEAWALNYFLLQQRSKDYVAYLKVLQQKPPMVWDDPTTRLKEFRAAFGPDMQKLDTDFLRLIRRLK